MRPAPAVRENEFQLLHKRPQNDIFDIWTNKMSYLTRQKKIDHDKKSRFAYAARPRRAKMCFLLHKAPLNSRLEGCIANMIVDNLGKLTFPK